MRVSYLTGSALLLTATLAAAACSSDKTGTSPQPAGGSGGASSSDAGGGGGGKGGGGACKLTAADFVDGGCTDANKVFDGTCCIDKPAGVQLCKDNSIASVPGTKVDDPTCGAGCTCVNCVQDMLDCGADPDKYCPTILACAQEHNCTGVACYAANTCQTVIDAAPGGGLTAYSVALATKISGCAVAANCAASCP